MTVFRRVAARVANPVMRRAASAYIAGAELADGLRVVAEVERRGCASTLGFWDGLDDSPRAVADAYILALRAMRQSCGDCYLSIKLPALGFSNDLLGEVIHEASAAKTRIHFDSLAADTVDRTLLAIEKFNSSALQLSVSLPGRWLRSLRDADWAAEMGVGVRVVKGQWQDESHADADLDPRQGFIDLVKRCGRLPNLAIATHDPQLASESLSVTKAAGSKPELELLFGLPARGVLEVAKQTSTPVRIYVPYGHAWLPYCMEQARKNPRILWWMLKDSMFARGIDA